MKRALIFSASFALALWAAPAVAQSNLTGKYGVTITGICTNNPPAASVGTFVQEDIHTFHGDGTGAVTGTNLTSVPGAIGSTRTTNFTYTFKYTVSSDRRFTVTVDPGSHTGTSVSGPNAGFTFSIDQEAEITGFIGIFATTLTGATLESPLETVTESNGITFQRRCQRSQVFIKVGEE